MSSLFVKHLSDIADLTHMRVDVIEDPQDGSEWTLTNMKDRKVIARITHKYHGPVQLLNKRVNAQHTMNCLSMAALDIREPFNKLENFHPDTFKAVRENFEDSAQAIYDTHVQLAKSGWFLWESKLMFVVNAFKLFNVYVHESTLAVGAWEQETAGIVLEAHVTTADMSRLFDTFKLPDAAWDIKIDSDYGRIGSADRIIPGKKNSKDMAIIANQSEDQSRQYPVEGGPSIDVCDAFDIWRITGKLQTSQSGRVNTVRTFRCEDHLERVFNLTIVYNID